MHRARLSPALPTHAFFTRCLSRATDSVPFCSLYPKNKSRKRPLSQYLNIILATGLLILLSCFPPYFLVSVTIVCIGCRLSICYEMNSCIFSMELHNIHFSCGIKKIFCPIFCAHQSVNVSLSVNKSLNVYSAG